MSSTTLTTRSTHDTRFVHNIRLWGKEGQEAIEQMHILALGCTSTVCQTIKNLVLPGAGHFTIVDDQKVTAENAQTNFFLSNDTNGPASDAKNFGKSLAECAKTSLVDLHKPNAETGGVTGETIAEDPNVFVNANPAAFSQFLKEKSVTVILIPAAIVRESTIANIAAVVEGDAAFARVFVLVLHVSGYIGAIRMASVKDATITKSIQAKEETFDTRYADPFPALKAWMDGCYPASPNVPDQERSRIPYFVLAYHALVAYTKRVNADGSATAAAAAGSNNALRVPDPEAEWRLARECLQKDVCTVEQQDGEGGGSSPTTAAATATKQLRVLNDAHENYTEAMALLTRAKGDLRARNVYELATVWRRADAILSQAKATASNNSAVAVNDVELYWFVAKAIQTFTKEHNNNNLPLSMEIPDFHTGTEWYRELVAIYRAESAREVEAVAQLTLQLMAAHGKTCLAAGDIAAAAGSPYPTPAGSPASPLGDDALRAIVLAKCKSMVPHARYLATTSYLPLSAEYASADGAQLISLGGSKMGTPSHSTAALLPAAADAPSSTSAAAAPVSGGPAVMKGVMLEYFAENSLHDPCGWYIALKTAHRFASHHAAAAASSSAAVVSSTSAVGPAGRFPGSINDDAIYESDKRSVAAKFTCDPSEDSSDVLAMGANDEDIMAQIEEVVRGGGGELITTAAIIGALAAQEVIKFVQQRYIPAGSLVVFDGHASLTHNVAVAAK